MKLIEVKELPNGAHRNQNSITGISALFGWAIIPDEVELPDSFPFVDVEAEIDKKTRLLTVRRLIGKEIPPNAQDNSERISELKKLLAGSDYAIIKIAEGAAAKEEYSELIAQREKWREEIRELEEK